MQGRDGTFPLLERSALRRAAGGTRGFPTAWIYSTKLWQVGKLGF